jgi:hypothetical protein
MAKEQYKTALADHLSNLAKFVKRPDLKNNVGSYLGEIFTWQEVEGLAAAKLKAAWKASQDSGLIPPDDDMRDKYDQDEHIVTESNAFSCLVTVGKPRKTFDLDVFLDTLAKKFKLDRARLASLAETCKKEGKAPLTKRIREA